MAENCAELPEDMIIYEIVLRLPVESVIRCKSVSKQWRRLLSSPRFAKAHLKRHVDNPPDSILFTGLSVDHPYYIHRGGENGGVWRQVNLPLHEPNMRVEGHPCHGLLLLSPQYGNIGKVLLNPITLESMEIPDCYLSEAKYFLGYDSVHDDYKILANSAATSRLNDWSNHNRVDIYSVKSNTWKRLANCPYKLHHLSITGKFVNGCIHWRAENERHDSTPFIAAFNLAKEEFEKVAFPLGLDLDLHWKVTVFDEHLALMVYDRVSGRMKVSWVMKEYGVQDSWFPEHDVYHYPCNGSHEWMVLDIPGITPRSFQVTRFRASLVSPDHARAEK